MPQEDQRDDQQHKAERARFFRALADAADDGMPMPFQVYFPSSGANAQVRFRSIAEVDAALDVIGGEAVHDDFTYEEPNVWHGYGNKYADAVASNWAGLTVEVWVAVYEPSPVKAAAR